MKTHPNDVGLLKNAVSALASFAETGGPDSCCSLIAFVFDLVSEIVNRVMR